MHCCFNVKITLDNDCIILKKNEHCRVGLASMANAFWFSINLVELIMSRLANPRKIKQSEIRY